MKIIVNDIITSLNSLINVDRIEFAKKTYPTAMKVLGVTVPNEKIILKELKTQTNHFSGREKLELAKELVNTNIFECQHIAFEYIVKDKKALNEITEKDIDEFYVNLDNWVSVDCYSAYLLDMLGERIKSQQIKLKRILNQIMFG